MLNLAFERFPTGKKLRHSRKSPLSPERLVRKIGDKHNLN